MDAEIVEMLTDAMLVLQAMRDYRHATARRNVQEVWA
jgi:hypothetical protein